MANTVVALTSAGATAIAQALGGTKLQITSAHFGSDIITSYSQTQLESLTEVVSNGTASAVYKSDSSVITYLYPAVGEIQFRVNLGSSIGDFTIGNWGLVDSTGTLLFIIGLETTEFKSATNDISVGDNRVFVLNVPLTSNLSNSIDFTVLNVDAAPLPEVTTETNLPSVDTSAYPVFHVQNYDSSNAPCLASRAEGAWHYYTPIDSLLSRNNTWTGINTFENEVNINAYLYANNGLYTDTINAINGTLNVEGNLITSGNASIDKILYADNISPPSGNLSIDGNIIASESVYVNTNQLLVRGWDGTPTDHPVKTIGIGYGDSEFPFIEYYNNAGSESGDTTIVPLATMQNGMLYGNLPKSLGGGYYLKLGNILIQYIAVDINTMLNSFISIPISYASPPTILASEKVYLYITESVVKLPDGPNGPYRIQLVGLV